MDARESAAALFFRDARQENSAELPDEICNRDFDFLREKSHTPARGDDHKS